MKILITGSSGLVGQNLQDIIKSKESFHDFYYLTSSICDLRNDYEVSRVFKTFKPDVVIHLASLVAGLYGNLANNYQFFSDNIKINLNILNACDTHNVSKLINILSTCVFPAENIVYPLTSDQILNGPPDTSNEGYAYSKRILYCGSNILSKKKNIQIINLIPTNLYGKYDNFNVQSGHVLPALINKIFTSKYVGNTLNINGTGESFRQFLYAKDFAQIIYNFIDYKSDLPWNFISCIVCPPVKDISIKELVNILVKKIEYEGDIKYDTSYENGQYKKTASSEEISQFFPNFIWTSLSDGLDETINFFKHNKNIRK